MMILIIMMIIIIYKYKNLDLDKKNWKLQSVKILPIVLTWEGLVSKFLSKKLQDLEIPVTIMNNVIYLYNVAMNKCLQQATL